MKFKILIFILSIVTVLVSCKKQDFPEPTVSEPVFRLTADIGGVALNLNPGEDGNFMFTDQTQPIEGNVNLSSGIAPSNCPQCGPAIWVEWAYNDAPGGSDPFDPELHFLDGNYDFRSSNEESIHELEILNFDQLVNNGGIISLNDLPVEDESAILNLNNFPLTSISYFSNQDPLFLVQSSMSFAQELLPDACDQEESIELFSFGAEITEDVNLIIYPPAGILQDFQILWSINNSINFASTGTEPIEIEIPGFDVTEISAVIIDEMGFVIWQSASVILVNLPGVIDPFGISISRIAMPQLNSANVVLKYVDADGNVFSTFGCEDVMPQPPTSFFEIGNQEVFEPNQEGVLTRIVSVNTQALLFAVSDSNDPPVQVNIENARFGFAVGD